MDTKPKPAPNSDQRTWSCACRKVQGDDYSDFVCSRCGQPAMPDGPPVSLVVDNEARPTTPPRRNPPRTQQHGNLPPEINLREIVYRWEYVETKGKRAEMAAARGEVYMRRLNNSAIKVAIDLLDHRRPGSWIACRSQEGIATDLGIKENTVRAAIEQLRKAGFITAIRRREKRGGGYYFEYQLNHARLSAVAIVGERPSLNPLPATRSTERRSSETPARSAARPVSLQRLPQADEIPSCNPRLPVCSICQGTRFECTPKGARPCICHPSRARERASLPAKPPLNV